MVTHLDWMFYLDEVELFFSKATPLLVDADVVAFGMVFYLCSAGLFF